MKSPAVIAMFILLPLAALPARAADEPEAVYAKFHGALVAGNDAERLARADPAAFEPNPKRRVDDGTVLLGSHPVAVSDALAAVLLAVVEQVKRAGPLGPQDVADLAASVELAICDTLIDRTRNALAWFRRHHPEGKSLVAAGGVAANLRLRTSLAALAASAGLEFVAPPVALCTDNGAMIAWAGLERLRLGLTDGLDAPVRPRWPLDETAGGAERSMAL